MQINPPFGYKEIVPLHKENRVSLPAPGAVPEFCNNLNAVPSLARNLLLDLKTADSSGLALGMTLSKQVCRLLRQSQ
jgi:hypothetical protein